MVEIPDAPPKPEEPAPEEPAQNRSWLTGQQEEVRPAPPRAGGTLFERMSNIARGAAKAQVDEEPDQGPRLRTGREPLDIPRFLNRQNNQ